MEKPAFTVELRSIYHEPLNINALPLALGTAVCVALQLVQGMMPLLVGEDIQQFVWFEQELADDALSLARETDLAAMTPEDLEKFIDADPNTYMAISEQLHMGNDPVWMLDRLRDLSAPPPAAKVTADRYLPVSTDTKAALLLQWLDEWADQSPSLADHPLARWVAKVAEVTSAQVAAGRNDRAVLCSPDDGDFTPPDQGIVVTLGERWEDQSLEYLFERLNTGEESPLSLLALDPLALSDTRATLMALAEGTALLECLSVLNQ